MGEVLAQVKQMMGLGKDFKEAPKPEKKNEEPPKETCRNCAEAIDKPLRCGVCKAATYCSAKCQKEDWQFHKRTCKKPDAAKPKQENAANSSFAPEKRETEEPKKEPMRPKASDSEVVSNEDVGTWYKHREWKPEEPKKDFIPERVASEVTTKAPESASTWNAAGTWEEKSMVPWWRDKLMSLKKLKLEKFGGTSRYLKVEKVELRDNCEANIMHIRGTPRFFFDLKFDVEFCYG